MFCFFNIFKKKQYVPDDVRIKQIIDLLFPSLQRSADDLGIFIDYGVDGNLEGALYDLQEGQNDKLVHDTISDVIDRLSKARQILEAYRNIDKDAKFIVFQPRKKKEIVCNE